MTFCIFDLQKAPAACGGDCVTSLMIFAIRIIEHHQSYVRFQFVGPRQGAFLTFIIQITISLYIFLYIYTFIYRIVPKICIYLFIALFIYIYIYIYVCVYIYIYLYSCFYIYVYIYI